MDIISQYFKFIYIIIPISIISLKFIYQKKYAYNEEFEGKNDKIQHGKKIILTKIRVFA